MGSGESTSRRVSFGLDEDDRVRILRDVKLSEDVLQHLRHQSQASDSSPPVTTKENPGQQPPETPPPKSQSRTHCDGEEEFRKRYEQQQAIIQEELSHIAQREREAAYQDITGATQRERESEREQTPQEPERAEQLGKQLEKKEAELKALDAFCGEQISQLGRKNEERFKMSAEQFHVAAAHREANIKPRNVEPVCLNLQARILNCYRENREQTLQCSDLVREYMQCINAAKKSLLVNHG